MHTDLYFGAIHLVSNEVCCLQLAIYLFCPSYGDTSHT